MTGSFSERIFSSLSPSFISPRPHRTRSHQMFRWLSSSTAGHLSSKTEPARRPGGSDGMVDTADCPVGHTWPGDRCSTNRSLDDEDQTNFNLAPVQVRS